MSDGEERTAHTCCPRTACPIVRELKESFAATPTVRHRAVDHQPAGLKVFFRCAMQRDPFVTGWRFVGYLTVVAAAGTNPACQIFAFQRADCGDRKIAIP